jgi:hypothetical protein
MDESVDLIDVASNRQVAGACKCGNDLSGSVVCVELLE